MCVHESGREREGKGVREGKPPPPVGLRMQGLGRSLRRAQGPMGRTEWRPEPFFLFSDSNLGRQLEADQERTMSILENKVA